MMKQSTRATWSLIPLSRLVPSAFNVRKFGGEDVGELATLTKALGLLQNLVVHPDETKRGKSTGDYGVAAGGRRLRALGLLAKAGDMPADKDILCRLITRDAAIAASVAPWLWGAITLSLLLQVAVVNLDFLNLAFGTVPLAFDQWLCPLN